MIKNITLKALQKALNHALNLDPASEDKIANLHGKVLNISVSPLGVNFFIKFEDELKLYSDCIDSVDAVIQTSPMGLIRLSLLPASKMRSLFNDQIKVTGDVEFGQEVKKLFDELDIDWEGHLAQFTGDVVAHQLGSFVRNGLAFTKHTQASLQQQASEYLQEEMRLVPTREEIEDFFHDVDELSLQVERLTAQITQIYELP